MTSNLGSDIILDASLNNQNDGIKEKIDVLLKQHFKPEFLNRIDEVIMFNSLGKEHIKNIVRLQLQHVAKRLEQRRLSIHFEDAAVDFISKVGYDPAFGARPVKRAVQMYVENPLAKEILAGKFADNSEITVDCSSDGNTLVFH